MIHWNIFDADNNAHTSVCIIAIANEVEDPYPSLSDYHDYEPNLEFDDTELQTTSNNGKTFKYKIKILIKLDKIFYNNTTTWKIYILL